jgi:hypothetical protein
MFSLSATAFPDIEIGMRPSGDDAGGDAVLMRLFLALYDGKKP